MQKIEFPILTTEEIRNAVRSELADFFIANNFLIQPEADEIGDVAFASKITGKAIPTIYDLVSKRLIPHSKKGKKLYFSKRELIDWINSGKRKTTAEINAAASAI
jgi:predicted DNA-binding transcriptional regulator AlpA